MRRGDDIEAIQERVTRRFNGAESRRCGRATARYGEDAVGRQDPPPTFYGNLLLIRGMWLYRPNDSPVSYTSVG